MYGNTLTIYETLTITIFSMALVFVALIIISYFIDFIAMILKRSKKETVLVEASEAKNEIIEIDEDSEAIIAVISAAIASNSGKSLQDFVIRNISPMENHESSWAQVGRAEAMR